MASTASSNMFDRAGHDDDDRAGHDGDDMSDYIPFKAFKVSLKTKPIMKMGDGTWVSLLPRQMAAYYSMRYAFEGIEMPEHAKDMNSPASEKLNRKLGERNGFKWKAVPPIHWENMDKRFLKHSTPNDFPFIEKGTLNWHFVDPMPDEQNRWSNVLNSGKKNQFAALGGYYIKTSDGFLRRIHTTDSYETVPLF